MKKKIMSVCLTLCMALTMLPTHAFAAEPQKLATPTEIQWSRIGEESPYDERVGFVWWKVPTDGATGAVAEEYKICIYYNDETTAFDEIQYFFSADEKETGIGSAAFCNGWNKRHR